MIRNVLLKFLLLLCDIKDFNISFVFNSFCDNDLIINGDKETVL